MKKKSNKLKRSFGEMFLQGIRFIILNISQLFITPVRFRPYLLGLCGIKFKNKRCVFIGQDVFFDINSRNSFSSARRLASERNTLKRRA